MIIAGLLKHSSSGSPAVSPKDAAISEEQAGLAIIPRLTANNSHLSQMPQKRPGQEGKTYLLATEICC